jgi:DNA polymerase
MFVGEAPGREEDTTGRPFVGRSGELLIDLLNKIGLSRESVFITSVLKCRPPGNRTPRKEEIETCLPYLHRQIEIVRPDIIVLLGGVATSSLIGPWKLSDAHGRFYEANGDAYFITYHPAAALRFPKMKSRIEKDFEILEGELK